MGTIVKALLGKVTSFVIPPWVKIAALAIVAAAVFSAGYWTKSTLVNASNEKVAVKSLKDQQVADKKVIEEHNGQQAIDQGESDASSKERDRLSQQVSELQHALALAKLVEFIPQKVTRNETGEYSCPAVSVRSATYGVCVNAAINGTDAEIAACKADRGYAAM